MLLLCTLFIVSCEETSEEFIWYTAQFFNDGEFYQSLSGRKDGHLPKPKEPEKTGYDFVGWYSGDTMWNFDSDIVEGEIILHSKWTVNFPEMFADCLGDDTELAEDGSYAKLDTNTFDEKDYHSLITLEKIKETNKKLGFSDDLYYQMIFVSSEIGTQTAENEYVTVEWTNTANQGLQVKYTMKK